MSKSKENIVYIRRKTSKNARNKDLKLMEDNASRYMGSAGYKGTELPITGLEEIEKIAIMPSLVSLSATHPEFDVKVNEYFHNLRAEVKAGKGLRLNITTKKKEVMYAGEKHTIDVPVAPLDYVLYKRAICPDYKQCASELDHTSGDRVKFYIHDVEKAAQVEEEVGDERDNAYDAFLKLTDKPEDSWNAILIIYGFDPELLNKREKKARLRLIAQADGVIGQENQLKHFKEFIDRTTDTKVDVRAKLKKFVKAQLIINEGTSYIYSNKEGTVTIGRTEEQAVAWLENPEHSEDVQILEARLNKING